MKFNKRKVDANYWTDKTGLKFLDFMIIIGPMLLLVVAGIIVWSIS